MIILKRHFSYAIQFIGGTPAYISPEVLEKKLYDDKIDWYMMGALLYEMLTGIPPYIAKTK